MLLGKGTKVKLKYTGDKGEIVGLLKDGMVNVYLYEDDMEIPVSTEDLVRLEEVVRSDRPPIKARILPAKMGAKKPAPPKRKDPDVQYKILKSYGIQLCFEPIWDSEGQTSHYKIWLINDLRKDFIVSLKISYVDETDKEWNGQISQISKTEIGDMPYDKLSDNPVFELQKWRISTMGTDDHSTKTIKIKPKKFFSSMKTAPILNRPVHWYLVYDEKEKKVEKGEDLREYTKRNATVFRPESKADWKYYETHDVLEFASFTPEIDLHAEALGKDIGKMDNAQILRLQLTRFEDFMDNAIRVGVPKVYIIHGVGKGRLRDRIATRLMNMQDVKTFKNEYHERYGFGATEVIF